MLSKKTVNLAAIASSLFFVGCASQTVSTSVGGHGVFYDSAMDDHNRAPASMVPPHYVADGVESNLDPVYMRTQADFHFSMGEAQSLDGNHQKAIESFKMVLVYDADAPQVNLRLAAEYVKMGMVTEALERAELAVKKDPKFVDGKLLLGGLYSTLKVYDKAIVQYEQVLKLDAGNTEAPMYLGAVYAEMKNYDKAVKYFEKLAKDEDYTSPHLAWYYIGRIRTEQGGKNFLKAGETAFKKAIEIKPDHVESVLALGQLYTKLEQEPRAVELYKNFQRERGPNARLAEILANNYLEQEKYEEALEQFEVLERYGDDSLNAKVKIALILIEQKKYAPAIDKLKDVLKQVPDSDKIRFYLAAVYEEIGRGEEAIEHFQKVPSESQYFGEAMVHATYLLKQGKKVDKALSLIEKSMQARQDIPQFYAINASLLDEKSEYKKAIGVLEKGAEKFPDNVQLHFFLGTVNDRLGNKDAVVAAMNKVIEMDPNHVQGLNYLAFTYAEADKNLDVAEKLVRRALEIEPKDGYILDTLGWILFKKGQFSDSVKVLEAAYKFQPEESIIAEHLGDAYNKAQLLDKAKFMYQKAAESESDEQKVKAIRQKITALEKQELRLSSDRTPASVENNP